MATLVLDDASVVIDGNDISDHVQSVSIDYGAERLDETAMGDSTRVGKGGLKTWSMEVTLFQNFANGEIDGTLFPLVGTVVTVTVEPTSSGVGADNPSYSGSCLVEGYPPLGNSVGEVATTTLSLGSAGDLARAV